MTKKIRRYNLLQKIAVVYLKKKKTGCLHLIKHPNVNVDCQICNDNKPKNEL